MKIVCKEHGRELMIRYTCCRCKAQELLPYESSMKESYDILSHSEIPKGWVDASHGNELFCSNCWEEYLKFLRPQQGEWILHHDEILGDSEECSICHIQICGRSPYCPVCGTKMKEENPNE